MIVLRRPHRDPAGGRQKPAHAPARPACEKACASRPRPASDQIGEGRTIRLVPVSVLAAVALCAAACGGNGQAGNGPASPSAPSRPHSTARLSIVTPAKGEVIHAGAVHARVRLTGASTEHPATTQAQLGWLHFYFDSKITSIEPVTSNDSVTGQNIDHVKPGRHTLKVEFVGPDHLPFRRRVIAAVTFAVRR